MVYKTDLAGYELATIEQYFEMIVETRLNGNITDANELIKTLSKDQKKDLIDWCEIWSDDSNIDDPYVIVKESALSLI